VEDLGMLSGAPVAQWTERLTTDQKVGGSTPSGRASTENAPNTRPHTASQGETSAVERLQRATVADIFPLLESWRRHLRARNRSARTLQPHRRWYTIPGCE
jgi:hypothetical protein